MPRQASHRIFASACLTIAIALAMTGVTVAPAAASPRIQHVLIHVRDLAHYPLAYMRRVQRAVQYQANQQLHPVWRTPLITFDTPSAKGGPSNSWLVDVAPLATVMYGLYTSANGFHLPGSPVYIGIAGRDKTQPMSLILSHEVLEALVDPHASRMTDGLLTEVCDPVEQPGYRINGITVSNFVTPKWFASSALAGRFDFKGLLTSALTITSQGFMPPRSGNVAS